MSNILFNNTPMDAFLENTKTRRSPVRLVVNDLFSLSKDEAEKLSNLITDVACQMATYRRNLMIGDDFLKSRPDKEQDKVL